jgi:acyl-coenzyme A thioesterase PaaI-like protein
MVCLKIPYFFNIKPSIVELEEGRAVVQMKERRSVHNHLKTVHAIAMCNLCEFAMAVVTESTIPKNLKFIPVGMSVEYKRKAKGTLRGITQIRKEDFKVGDVGISVDVFDENDINVMSAVITLNIKDTSA